MSSRWASWWLGGLAALLVALPLSLVQAPVLGGHRQDLVVVLILAGVVGLGVGSLAAVLAGQLRAELRRLAAHVEATARGERRPGLPRFRLGLQPVADSVDKALAAAKARNDQWLSQKRELEVQLRITEAQRRHAEAILNSIADAVLVTDAFNELALANESAARLLGFDLAQSLHRPVDQVVVDPVLVKFIKDTREGGDTALRRHVEHRLGSNGQAAIYDVTFTCVAGPAGQTASAEPAGVVTILRDITRDKEISEMKSDFVSAVSHELRTPLSSIKAYMEMLVDGEAQDDATRAEFYNIVQGEANRLSRLIDNILNISRIESGVVKIQREHVSLPALIRDVVEVLLPQARARQIELVEVATPVFFQVFADKDMIYQAILNLTSNAIKYTQPGGKVTLAIAVDDHSRSVRVMVTDTGVGIPPEALPHLFSKFYRVAEHKKMAKGTGLGLNLVKQIVETVHGGKVSVTSQVGQGSTFTFSLPMAEESH